MSVTLKNNPVTVQPFHLAIEVSDLPSSRQFYGDLMGFTEGRSSESWVDYDFFGHQVVCHVTTTYPAARAKSANPVDGHSVPVPHFGVILDMPTWETLAERLKAAGVSFVIEPYVRFKGEPGEQATMFFLDPSGNALEFKAFSDPNQIFAN